MKKDIPSEDEILCQIALLFLMTQDTEHSLSSFIGTIYPNEKPTWDEIETLNKNTLGKLIKKLKERADMNDAFIKLLEIFLEGRNIFIHKLTKQEWFDTTTHEGRDQIWNFLENCQKCLEEIYHVINAAILEHTENIGMPETEFHRKLKETGYFDLIKSYSSKARIAFRGRKQ
ncbi:MAG: hypothetical protein ABSH15_16660 [Verrucomicrobiota bacterium]